MLKQQIFVIEGTDGSGKQTQAKLLAKFLTKQNLNVKMQSFPNYESQSSGPVKMYLQGELCKTANELDAFQASALFAVDRLCTTKKLQQEKGVDCFIFDRYVESNLLHQAGKISEKIQKDEFIEWIKNFEYKILKLPRPTQVFFLDMPPKQSMKLAMSRAEYKSGASKDIHEQDAQHIQNAYNTGKYVAQKLNWTIINCVNANGEIKSIDDIHKEICSHLKLEKELQM